MLEQQHKMMRDVETQKKLDAVTEALKMVAINTVSKDILYAEQRIFEYWDRPARSLAQYYFNLMLPL